MLPPISPKLMRGAPFRVTNPGMIVWKGRFPGATWLGWPSVRTRPEPRFCRLIPGGGRRRPERKHEKFDWMMDDMMQVALGGVGLRVAALGGEPGSRGWGGLIERELAREG